MQKPYKISRNYTYALCILLLTIQETQGNNCNWKLFLSLTHTHKHFTWLVEEYSKQSNQMNPAQSRDGEDGLCR